MVDTLREDGGGEDSKGRCAKQKNVQSMSPNTCLVNGP